MNDDETKKKERTYLICGEGRELLWILWLQTSPRLSSALLSDWIFAPIPVYRTCFNPLQEKRPLSPPSYGSPSHNNRWRDEETHLTRSFHYFLPRKTFRLAHSRRRNLHSNDELARSHTSREVSFSLQYFFAPRNFNTVTHEEIRARYECHTRSE